MWKCVLCRLLFDSAKISYMELVHHVIRGPHKHPPSITVTFDFSFFFGGVKRIETPSPI